MQYLCCIIFIYTEFLGICDNYSVFNLLTFFVIFVLFVLTKFCCAYFGVKNEVVLIFWHKQTEAEGFDKICLGVNSFKVILKIRGEDMK
jgi:hypothetical protein